MPGRDDRAEGVAEEREAVELERLGEQVDIPCEGLEAEGRRIDALALSLTALVHVEDAELLAEGSSQGRRCVWSRPGPPWSTTSGSPSSPTGSTNMV